MNKTLLIVIGLAVLIGGGFLFFYSTSEEKSPASYTSSEYGLSFSYPQNYTKALEQTLNGERERYAIVLAEDTLANRELFSNPNSATEAPPTITITIFQNNLVGYTLQSFVEGTNFSNFKMSDGTKTEMVVGGKKAWRYRATGLYENDNVVVVQPDYVYMFTAFFNSPSDQILSVFDGVVNSVEFTTSTTTTSADDAPAGSIHNLPVPSAVSAVRAKVAADLGVREGLVLVMTAYEKTWTNGCLDLGKPGEACTEALVQGYEVTVQAQGKEFTYRTNSDGTVLREDK